MPCLHYSQFNHVVKAPDVRGWVLYNFATGSLERLNELYVDARGDVYPSCHVIAGDDAYGLGNVSDEGPIDWDAAARKLTDDFAFPDDRPQCLAC